MMNETKWDVFKIAMKYAAKSGWLDYDDMINRYDAALPDDLPVIPAEVANAIEEYRDKFGSGEGLFTLIADISAPWALGTLETVTAIPEITLREFIDKTDVLARAWLDGYEIDNKS